MSDPKLCPMSHSATDYFVGFHRCAQEKCEWWVPAVEGSPKNTTHPQEWGKMLSEGHCAILDIGRKGD